MNRRRLLQLASALGGISLYGEHAWPQPAVRDNTVSGRRRFGANISMMFTDVPLTRRFARAAAAGFQAIEMQFPYDETPEALAAAARAAGVAVALINVPVIAGDDGPMTSSAPGQEASFREAVATARRYAAALDCPCVNVLPGNRIPDVPFERQIEVYRRNLGYAAEQMRPVGVTVVAEPINTVDRPTMLIATADAMREVFAGTGRDDLFIQFDIYHAAMMGEDPLETFARHRDRIGHIQFADAPGRHEPGTGNVDFEAIFAAIDASGYAGWLCAEYNPAGVTEAGLAWLADFALHSG